MTIIRPSVHDNPHTGTSLFLVPVLGFTKKELRAHSFINGYSSFEDRSYTDCIFLVFKPKDQSAFGLFLDKYKELSIEVADYEFGYSVVVCPFPVKYINDKNLFWKGAFSKFSKDFRSNFNKIDNKAALGVMNKAKDLKAQIEAAIGQELDEDSEIRSIPTEEQETLYLEMLRDKTK